MKTQIYEAKDDPVNMEVRLAKVGDKYFVELTFHDETPNAYSFNITKERAIDARLELLDMIRMIENRESRPTKGR